jgi:hypothetical protein
MQLARVLMQLASSVATSSAATSFDATSFDETKVSFSSEKEKQVLLDFSKFC